MTQPLSSIKCEKLVAKFAFSNVGQLVCRYALGQLRWHNPLRNEELVNNALLSQAKCTSGIRC
jgi:hypothetical protein